MVYSKKYHMEFSGIFAVTMSVECPPYAEFYVLYPWRLHANCDLYM